MLTKLQEMFSRMKMGLILIEKEMKKIIFRAFDFKL